ncbi:MAG: hypothetical protein ACMUIU_02545 [bacterium]
MPEWKIADRKKRYKPEMRIAQEKFLDEDLNEKIIADPRILGEPFLLIGQQVLIPETDDKLDFLALDRRGNSVIIELIGKDKKDKSEFSALKYVSHISKWGLEDFETQSRTFLGKTGDTGFNLNALFESFCEDSGVGEKPEINRYQRVVIAGSEINEKIVKFATWLKEQGVHITVVELQAFKDGEIILIQPNFIIAAQPDNIFEAEESEPEEDDLDSKWKIWHLDKRCSPETKQMCLKLDKILHENFNMDGPIWNQKSYITYRIRSSDWLNITTAPNILRLDFFVSMGSFSLDDIAMTLKIAQFDNEEIFQEEEPALSSVFIKDWDKDTEQVQIRIKEDFDLESDRFLVFLEEAYRAFPK